MSSVLLDHLFEVAVTNSKIIVCTVQFFIALALIILISVDRTA